MCLQSQTALLVVMMTTLWMGGSATLQNDQDKRLCRRKGHQRQLATTWAKAKTRQAWRGLRQASPRVPLATRHRYHQVLDWCILCSARAGQLPCMIARGVVFSGCELLSGLSLRLAGSPLQASRKSMPFSFGAQADHVLVHSSRTKWATLLSAAPQAGVPAPAVCQI